MNILETIQKIILHPVSRETNFDGFLNFLDTKKISTNDFNLLSCLITFPIKNPILPRNPYRVGR